MFGGTLPSSAFQVYWSRMQYCLGSKKVRIMLARMGLMPSSNVRQFIRYPSSQPGMLNAWPVSRPTFASSLRATSSKLRVFFSASSLNFHSTTEVKSLQVSALFLRNLLPSSRSRCACQPNALSYLRLQSRKSALST